MANDAFFAARTRVNQQAVTAYGAALAGLVGAFVLLHWIRRLVHRPSLPAALSRTCAPTVRLARSLLLRQAPVVDTAGHGVLVLVYVALNIGAMLARVDLRASANVASRVGWLLVSNLFLVVFLALKSTPLAWLTGHAHERLKALHRLAGCTTFLLLVVHAATYSAYLCQHGKAHVLVASPQIAGIVAACMFCVMVAAALVVRRIAYRVFYALHTASFVVALVCIAVHRPDIRQHVPVVVGVTAALVAVDHLLRLRRLFLNAMANTATLYPLPGGATRVVLARAPPGCVPGQHVFLWLPRARALATHPFTVVSVRSGRAELVVKAVGTFTHRLHDLATARPGVVLWSGADGPYGAAPEPAQFDHVLLVAGGSGGSFAFGLAARMLDRLDPLATNRLTLAWTVPTHDAFAWYADHINALTAHRHAADVRLALFASRARPPPLQPQHEPAPPVPRSVFAASRPASSDSWATSIHGVDADASDKDFEMHDMHEHDEHDHDHDRDHDVEKTATAPTEVRFEALPLSHSVSAGRPDVDAIVRAAVAATPRHQRILVAACGPPALTNAVRNTTAACISGDGPSVELHIEQFGW